jgi:hypothetical protein
VTRPQTALLALLLATGCSHGTGRPAPAPGPAAALAPADAPGATPAVAFAAPAPAADPDPLARVRDDVDRLLTAQGEAAWKGWIAGQPLDLGAAWQGRQALLAPETLGLVDGALRAAPEGERRPLVRLRAFLVGERLARATAAAAQAAAAARAAATFAWEKRSIPLRQLPALLAAEPEPARRRQLEKAGAAALARLAPLVAARQAAVASAAGALGFEGTLPLAAALRGEDPAALAALAEATLARTDATWRALLDALARRELQAPAERLRERDLPRLLRTTADPQLFPAARLLPDAAAVLAGLGLDLGAGGHVTVDDGARPGKPARPLAVPVEVPGSVRLALTPVAGLEALRALLHELGVAQASARVTAPGVEARRLLPAALPDAWGRLLAGVAAAPEWLSARGLDAEAVRREVRVAAARRLRDAREAAALVLAEVARAREPASAAARWAVLGPRALGHPLDPGEPAPWVSEPDPLLRAAETLQGVLLEAQVEAALGRKAGGPWWRSPQAGAWLAGAWADGALRSAADLARSLGAAGLDPAPLDELTRAAAAAGGLDLGAPAAPPAAGPASSTNP